MIFDSNGSLIFPLGTIEYFREEMKRMKNPHREKTGIRVSCPRCGHQWEKTTRKARKARCYPCGRRIELGNQK